MIDSRFAFAGKASFVVRNPRGDSATIRVVRSKKESDTFFVSVRWNNDPWMYIGKTIAESPKIVETFLVSRTRQTMGSSQVDKLIAIANWTLTNIVRQTSLPTGYDIHHTGHCGRCGKLLRDTESIARGIGPECRRIMGV